MKTLREIDPIAADEWYYPLNEDMTPDNITGKSARWAYFQCHINPKHIFHRQIYATLDAKGNHKGCPFCKGKEVFPGETDLLTICSMAKEMWDYEKNTIDPTRLLPNAKCFAYFKCKLGHSFQIEVYKFKRRPFCRECKKEKNSLLAANPSVARIWDYEKNVDDRPEYHWKSDHDLAWWKCKKCGYGWQAKISTKRLNKSLCPVCEVGKRFKKNINDLLTKFPDVILDWNYEKNMNLSPSDVSLRSIKVVWWKCHVCGYEWEASIKGHIIVKNDIINFRKCPSCMGRYAHEGKNDLATTHPSLANEYVPELNSIPLSKIRPGSGRNITWRCKKCQQIFTTAPVNRTQKDSRGGCPYCSGKYPIPNFTDFASQYPHIALEWDFDKNLKRPNDYTCGSQYNAHWKCHENPLHKWKATILDRKPGFKRCPYCNNPETVLDLSESKPKLIKYWDYDKNNLGPERYTIFSSQIVYWKCKKGHSFQNRICNYLEHDFKCPICNDIKIIEYINDFELLYPDLVCELDISRNLVKPNQLNCDSEELIWWICPDAQHTYQMSVYSRIRLGKSCPICSINKTNTTNISLVSQYPGIAEIWDSTNNDGLTPEDIPYSSRASYNYVCNSGHKWNESLSTLKENNFSCAYCNGRRLLPGFNSVADKYPHLLNDWNTKNLYNPDMLLFTSKVTISWICYECGQSYYSGIEDKLNGTSKCPYCSGEKGIRGETSIMILYPEVCKEYDKKNPINPDDIGPLSALCVSWNCLKCDMTWHSTVLDRINGSATCPYCSGLKAIPGRTSFKALYPEMMNEYSPTNGYNPDELVPSFTISMKWICLTCNLEWEASIRDRVNGVGECPFCSGRKAIPGITSFKALYPELSNEYSPINPYNPDELLPTYSLYYIKWNCSTCNMEWEASIRDRVNGNAKCPYCYGMKAIPGRNSFKALYPEMVTEYSPNNEYNPDELLPSYTMQMIWNCPTCKMVWESSIKDRVNGNTECPYCSGRKAIPGKTSFKALFPEMVLEYSPVNQYNPDELLPSYTLPMKWHCYTCDLEWESSIKDRVNGNTECPYCSGRKAIPGKTSFKALFPEIMNEWKYISNLLLANPDYVLPTSTKEVWWECPYCNKSYSMKIMDKVNMYRRSKKSCPFCKGYRKAKRRYM